MINVVFLENGFDVRGHLWWDTTFTVINKAKGEFIYPVLIDTLDTDNYLIPDYISKSKGKVLFIQTHECGFASKSGEELEWISELVSKHELNKERFLLVTSDHLIEDKFNTLLKAGRITDNFTVKPFTYFKNTLWFRDYLKRDDGIFKSSLESNKKVKQFHFLNFNRATKKHRICIFGELMTNPNFNGKFITSLGHNVCIQDINYVEEVKTVLNEHYKNRTKLIEFFKSYNPKTHFTYDETDLENSKAANLNVEAHNNTFVNIVTESSYEENFIFFTEKTFKPIYCAQPFIILGNPHSLKKLKELGFKTFSQWWDESYDEETDFTVRFSKIVKLMEEIASWSLERCLDVTKQMEDVFIHNFEVLNNKTEQEEVKNLLLGVNTGKLTKKLL